MVSMILGFTRKRGGGNILCKHVVRCYDCVSVGGWMGVYGASVELYRRGGGFEKCSEKNRPTATSSTINLTCTGLGSDPSHRSGRPATNHPSHGKVCMALSTVGSRFTTIHINDPCRIGPSTPDLWCFTVATQASFLYLVRFSFPMCMCFFFFCFSVLLLSWLWLFTPVKSIKKREKKKKSKQLTLHSFLMSSEPRPRSSSTI